MIHINYLFFLLFISSLFGQTPNIIAITPKYNTSPVSYDADDPAIWIHPTDPSRSLIIGTDKGTYPNGGLFVWNVDGSLQQRIVISHPSNVDIRYGMRLGNELVDIVAVSLRDHWEILIFKIDPISRVLKDITTSRSIKTSKSPYRLALYKRPKDGAMFVLVSNKDKEKKEKIWQIYLENDNNEYVKGTLVRVFGDTTVVVGGMVSDDKLGYLYVSGENGGIHKYFVDPEKGDERLALFATDNDIVGTAAGLALYNCTDSTGYLLVSNPGDQTIKVYRREGEKENPHKHVLLNIMKDINSNGGSGIDVTNYPISSDFPAGLLVWHNKVGKQFSIYSWESVAQNYLKICTE